MPFSINFMRPDTHSTYQFRLRFFTPFTSAAFELKTLVDNAKTAPEGENTWFRLEVTDKEGNTVVDENGNMLWKVTDADGNDQTHPVSFPAFLTDGRKIECQQFTIKLPSGWESTGNVNLIVKNQKKNLQIMGSFFKKSDEDYKTAQERATELIEKFGMETETYKTTVSSSLTQVGGRDAVKVIIDTTGETPSYSEVYYVELETGTISFWCSCGNYEDKGFDFKAILDTVEYRI